VRFLDVISMNQGITTSLLQQLTGFIHSTTESTKPLLSTQFLPELLQHSRHDHRRRWSFPVADLIGAQDVAASGHKEQVVTIVVVGAAVKRLAGPCFTSVDHRSRLACTHFSTRRCSSLSSLRDDHRGEFVGGKRDLVAADVLASQSGKPVFLTLSQTIAASAFSPVRGAVLLRTQGRHCLDRGFNTHTRLGILDTFCGFFGVNKCCSASTSISQKVQGGGSGVQVWCAPLAGVSSKLFFGFFWRQQVLRLCRRNATKC